MVCTDTYGIKLKITAQIELLMVQTQCKYRYSNNDSVSRSDFYQEA
jgi:hypothetical protein